MSEAKKNIGDQIASADIEYGKSNQDEVQHSPNDLEGMNDVPAEGETSEVKSVQQFADLNSKVDKLSE